MFLCLPKHDRADAPHDEVRGNGKNERVPAFELVRLGLDLAHGFETVFFLTEKDGPGRFAAEGSGKGRSDFSNCIAHSGMICVTVKWTTDGRSRYLATPDQMVYFVFALAQVE